MRQAAVARRTPGSPAFDLLVLAVAATGFAPVAWNLAAAWRSADYLAYGAAIAPVSIGLMWWQRPAIRRLPRRYALLGAPALLLSLALARIPLLFLQGAALVFGVWSTVWLLRGTDWLRRLAFPLGYLLFLIPPPEAMIATLTYNLRILVVETSLAFLHLLDLPVAREGNVILLPEDTLFVADACSGISSIFALIPAAVLLGKLSRGGWTRSVALLCAVVPIAMFWNLVRVIVTVLGSLRFGADTVAGALHEPAGLLTFSLGCATLVALDMVLWRSRTLSAQA